MLVDATLHLGGAVGAEALPGNMEGARGAEFAPRGVLCVDDGRGAGEPGFSVAQGATGDAIEKGAEAVEGREGGDVLGGGVGEGGGGVGVEAGGVGLEEACAGKGDHALVGVPEGSEGEGGFGVVGPGEVVAVDAGVRVHEGNAGE